MGARYSGSLVIDCSWNVARKAYRCAIRPRLLHAAKWVAVTFVTPPPGSTRNSPAALDGAARAALTAALNEGAPIADNAGYTGTGYAIGRTPNGPSSAHRRPARRPGRAAAAFGMAEGHHYAVVAVRGVAVRGLKKDARGNQLLKPAAVVDAVIQFFPPHGKTYQVLHGITLSQLRDYPDFHGTTHAEMYASQADALADWKGPRQGGFAVGDTPLPTPMKLTRTQFSPEGKTDAPVVTQNLLAKIPTGAYRRSARTRRTRSRLPTPRR